MEAVIREQLGQKVLKKRYYFKNNAESRRTAEEKGAKVTMTRVKDVDVYGVNATDAQELQARVDVAENSAADLLSVCISMLLSIKT